MNEISNIIFGFVLGLIGGLFGVIISHIFSERRDRRKEFNQAATNFRKAFINEIRILQNPPLRLTAYQNGYIQEKSIYDILARAYARHYTAYLLFREYLLGWDRIGLDMAWKNYCYPESHHEKSDPLISYLFKPMNGTKIIFDKAYILNKLEIIISYAKFK